MATKRITAKYSPATKTSKVTGRNVLLHSKFDGTNLVITFVSFQVRHTAIELGVHGIVAMFDTMQIYTDGSTRKRKHSLEIEHLNLNH